MRGLVLHSPVSIIPAPTCAVISSSSVLYPPPTQGGVTLPPPPCYGFPAWTLVDSPQQRGGGDTAPITGSSLGS